MTLGEYFVWLFCFFFGGFFFFFGGVGGVLFYSPKTEIEWVKLHVEMMALKSADT